jgi:hypothetical protein
MNESLPSQAALAVLRLGRWPCLVLTSGSQSSVMYTACLPFQVQMRQPTTNRVVSDARQGVSSASRCKANYVTAT